MIVSKSKMFYSEETNKTLAAEDIGTQIFSEIFGLSFTGRNDNNHLIARLSETVYFRLKIVSSYYLELHVGTTEVAYITIKLYTDSQTGKYYTTCSWVESEYLRKFGGIWLWKGNYVRSSEYEYCNLYDAAANTSYSSDLKDIELAGMVAIAPLYSTDGTVIQDAYMYKCNDLAYNKYYYIGGRLFFVASSDMLLAVES